MITIQPSGDFVFEPLKAEYGPLAKALTVNPQKVNIYFLIIILAYSMGIISMGNFF